MKPFVDYYGQHNISPVAQDISDLERHFDRRRSLYRSLGLPPSLVAGKHVVEFGPGSGYNAIYTASLKPARYVLVEANPAGLAQTQRLLGDLLEKTAAYEAVESLIEDYETDELFDIVLCEGTIPFQIEPARFTRKVASFSKPGGITIITCVSAASCLGEILRRLIASRVIDPKAPLPRRLEALRPVFAPHLATMQSMSRPVDDWILDNIIHPFIGRTFSIEQAIDALGDEYEVYGQSPVFIQDWRWYKDIHGPAKQFGQLAKDAHLCNITNFLDYRVLVPPHSPEIGRKIALLADEAYDLMQRYELQDEEGARRAACERILEIAEVVSPLSPLTATSLGEAATFVMGTGQSLNAFESYFGRAQQYLSFIRL